MRKGQLITGIIMIIIGAIMILLPFFIKNNALFFIWIYGIPILIIGLIILFNKNEDHIETINNIPFKKKSK